MRVLKELMTAAILASEQAQRNDSSPPDVIGTGIAGVKSIFGPYAIGKFGGFANAHKAGWV